MKRSYLRISSLLALVLMVTTGMVSSPAWGAEKVTLMLDWVPYGKYGGWYVGIDKGYYKNAGFEVTIQRGFGGAAPQVAAGSAEFGLDNPGAIVVGRQKGLTVKMVASKHDKGLQVIFVFKSSGIRTGKDLEGKKILVTPGDALFATFPAVAKNLGLKQWEWVRVDAAMKNPSFLAKKADAVATYVSVKPPLETQAKKQGEELVTLFWEDMGVPLPSEGIVVHDSRIKSHPDQVRRFVRASMEAHKWAIENPEETSRTFVRYIADASLELTREMWKISVDHMLTPRILQNGLGYIDPAAMKFTRDLMVDAYNIKERIEPEDIYTQEFFPKPPIFVKRPAM